MRQQNLLFETAAEWLIMMVVCAEKYDWNDRKDVRGNWIEKIINCVYQTLFLDEGM